MPWMWVLPATILTGGAVITALMMRRIVATREAFDDARQSLDSMRHAVASLVDSTTSLQRSDMVIRDRLATEPGENSVDR